MAATNELPKSNFPNICQTCQYKVIKLAKLKAEDFTCLICTTSCIVLLASWNINILGAHSALMTDYKSCGK